MLCSIINWAKRLSALITLTSGSVFLKKDKTSLVLLAAFTNSRWEFATKWCIQSLQPPLAIFKFLEQIVQNAQLSPISDF